MISLEEFDELVDAAGDAGDLEELERLYALSCEMIGGEPTDEEVTL